MTTKITFIRDTHPYEDVELHHEGETMACSAETRDRWLRREAVIEGELKPAAKSKAAKSKE